MDDNATWLNFKDQLQTHYEILEAYHKELGGDYEDSSSSLMSVLQAALEASLEATKAECDRVRQDCESMLMDMARIRTAMGEFSKSCSDDPFSTVDPQQRIKTPLLDSQKVLRIQHTAARKSFEERASKIIVLYDRLREYSQFLPANTVGVSIPVIDEQHPPDDVSLSKLGQLDAACARCTQELSRRKKRVQAYGKDIVQLWAELAVESSSLNSDFDRGIILDSQRSPETLGLKDEDLDRLEKKRELLLLQKTERQVKIEHLMTTIRSLHKKLQLPINELEVFLSQTRGVAQPVINACETELARLLDLKKDHIEEFVNDARETLNTLWDSLYFNEDDRLDFTPAFTDIFTDASLQAHENEIDALHQRIAQLEPLLTLLGKHMELNVEKTQLEAQTSDPARFARRGYNPMAESKLRAKVENTMPRLEAALRDALAKYEAENLVPFRVWGEIYFEDNTKGKQTISRNEAGNPHGLADSLTRPKTTDSTRKTRPRTPGVLVRPGTAAATPIKAGQALGRSISTPIRSAVASERQMSRSPSKRILSLQQTSGLPQSARCRVDVRNPKTNTKPTHLPMKSSNNRENSPEARSVVSRGHSAAKKPALSAQRIDGHARTMSPPKISRPMTQPVRDISGSSTSSQVSTENWDAYQPSSDEEEEEAVDGHDRSNSVYDKAHKTNLLEKYQFAPTSSTTSRNGKLESPLQEVPEETSFVDEWGDEGF